MRGACGDTNNGFGLLYNWNRLGDGVHTVTAYADGVEVESLLGSEEPLRTDVMAQPISEIVVCERLFRSEGLYPQALNTSEVIAIIGEHGQAMPERCCPDK